MGPAKRKSAKSSAFSKALKLMNKGLVLEEVVAGFTSTAWSVLHIRDGKGEEAGAVRLQSLCVAHALYMRYTLWRCKAGRCTAHARGSLSPSLTCFARDNAREWRRYRGSRARRKAAQMQARYRMFETMRVPLLPFLECLTDMLLAARSVAVKALEAAFQYVHAVRPPLPPAHSYT